ncbi:Aste57867_14294 [Aphanomyces stellatus]|uniref:Aste57867_14294 protein n=1 Tax=Aphanomyces stellatus TaxID=120398 RepID=A0A485L0A0_9STRA|nr:hypothetical protein As57867_014242 [Aphanomyces stellatus]VFT91119.1 Aste57867_14294 [Aphanomyces stellatus]
MPSTLAASPVPKRRSSSSWILRLDNNSDPLPSSSPTRDVPWTVYDALARRYDELEGDHHVLLRRLEAKERRVVELEAAAADMNTRLEAQTEKWHASCHHIEELQDVVAQLTQDKGRALQAAAELQPRLTEAQRHMAKMHDVMMDMEYEMIRLRGRESGATTQTARSQSHAIQRELRGLKKRRCVSQSKWLADGDDDDDDCDDDDDTFDDQEFEDDDRWWDVPDEVDHQEEGDGDDDSRPQAPRRHHHAHPSSFPVDEIDFLDLADQVVRYTREKTAATVAMWAEAEAALAVESKRFQDAVAAETAAMQDMDTDWRTSVDVLVEIDALLQQLPIDRNGATWIEPRHR